MPLIVIFILYQLFHLITLPLMVPYLAVKNVVAKNSIATIKEELGLIPRIDASKKVVWIHALSAGEVLSVERLVDEVKKKSPDIAVYLTTGTVEGKEIAQKQLRADYVSILPYDSGPSMMLAFNRIRPNAMIIVEHELWPNLVMLASYKKVPCYLINAQVTKQIKKKWTRYAGFYKPLLMTCSHIFAQSAHDQKEFEACGVPGDKVTVLGNIKAFNVATKKEAFYNSCSESIQLFKHQSRYPILLVGSVHQGELDIYIKLFTRLKPRIKGLKLILAPRYFQWKEELQQKCIATGSSVFMWDEGTDLLNKATNLVGVLGNSVLNCHDILLVCTLGSLFKLHSIADIFFLGGTFVSVGGHNLLEPAVWGNPMLIGPHYDNCKEIVDQLEQHKSLIKVGDVETLIERTEFLLKNAPIRHEMGVLAAAWSLEEARIVAENVETLKKWLNF